MLLGVFIHDVLVTRILICKHVLSNKTEKMVYIRVNLYEICFFLKYTRKVTGYSEIPNSFYAICNTYSLHTCTLGR